MRFQTRPGCGRRSSNWPRPGPVQIVPSVEGRARVADLLAARAHAAGGRGRGCAGAAVAPAAGAAVVVVSRHQKRRVSSQEEARACGRPRTRLAPPTASQARQGRRSAPAGAAPRAAARPISCNRAGGVPSPEVADDNASLLMKTDLWREPGEAAGTRARGLHAGVPRDLICPTSAPRTRLPNVRCAVLYLGSKNCRSRNRDSAEICRSIVSFWGRGNHTSTYRAEFEDNLIELLPVCWEVSPCRRTCRDGCFFRS